VSEQRGAGAAFDVAGRAAVVTGAARGIGRGIALELARAGADLVLGDVDESELAETAERAGAAGIQAEALRTDVSRRAEVEAYLTTHPDAAAQVLAYRRQNEGLRELFGPIADAGIPSALRPANVSARRYFCKQCHVPQANAQPLVKNEFKPVTAVSGK